jgi:nitrogenase-stabilizing/protective protein
MSALLDEMRSFESVEDFLDYFAVPYDVAAVNINRLHILKRFYQYLAAEGGVEALASASAHRTCRELLARAYTDLLNSSAIAEKVFKVFHTAQGEHRVALSALQRNPV